MQKVVKNSVNFIAKGFLRKLSFLLLLFVYSISQAQTVGDFRSSVVAGEWTVASTWQTYNGTAWVATSTYPGQNAGTYAVTILAGHTVTIPNTGITTAVMGTVTINGTLTLTGSNSITTFTFNTAYIYVTPGLTPLATIEFGSKCYLALPADAVFRVWAGGLSGPCSNNNRIIIGIVQYAQCNGAPGDIYTFQELMDSGGTLNAVLTSPSTSCLGSPVQLTGAYTGAIGTPVTYKWSSTGPVPLVFSPSSTAQNPTVTPVNQGAYTISLTVTTNKGGAVFNNTENVTLVVPPTSFTTNDTICQGESVVFNGVTYNTTGTYSKLLTSSVGCDSTDILNLKVNIPSSSTTNQTICSTSLPYVWNGLTFNATGSQSATLINAVGCDSIATLNLTVNATSSSTTNMTICSPQLPYIWNGLTFNTAGSQSKTLSNAAGCDSIATLNLIVHTPSSSTTNLTICSTKFPYVWNGLTFNTVGSQSATLVNAVGCDSIATLNLTENPFGSLTINRTICSTELPYIWNGRTFNGAGSQTVLICSTTVNMILSVLNTSSSTTNRTICSPSLPYVWNGLTFNAAGSQSATLINAVGCDSIATLNLTVLSTSSSTTDSTICSTELPLSWNGLTFNRAGSQSATLVNAVGCDSIATLNLTVNVSTSSTTDLSICPPALPYVWNGLTFNATGSQSATLTNAGGCDSIATLNLTVLSPSSSTTNLTICSSQLPYMWNTLTFNAAGSQSATLTNAVGCDSTATLNLTVNPSSSSTINRTICSTELPYIWNGLPFNIT